jgi:hypothetical protein
MLWKIVQHFWKFYGYFLNIIWKIFESFPKLYGKYFKNSKIFENLKKLGLFFQNCMENYSKFCVTFF